MAEVSEDLRLPPCKVCAGKSTGRHFGLIACEACKSFFKRNRNREKPYRCRGETKGACIVKAGLGYPICPFCRYQACIRAGMSREGIHKGRCPIELKAELLLQAKEYQAKAKAQKGKDGEENTKRKEKPKTQNKDVNSVQSIPNVCGPVIEPALQNGKVNGYVTDAASYHIHEFKSQNGISPTHDLAERTLFDPNVDIQSSVQGEFMALLNDTTMPSAEEILSELSPMEAMYRPDALHSDDVVSNSDSQGSDCNTKTLTIETIAQNIIDADAEAALYDPEELVDVQTRIENYLASTQAKEALCGKLGILPHDVYTEVYQSTGLDIDDYRAKVFCCIRDMKPDIDVYLDFVRRIPAFKDFSLNDRTMLTKGGYPGWMLLSSVGAYCSELDIWACTPESIHSTNDFIRYFSKMYSDSIRTLMTLIHQYSINTAELAVIKVINFYKARSQVGKIEDMAALDRLQEVLLEALRYVVEKGRGPEQAKSLMPELANLFPTLDAVTVSFTEGVKTWPVKFPEYSYPRILLEMVGNEAEEELLVAVSVQLNMND